MDDVRLDQILTGPANRDAVHIAVLPVTVNQNMDPGTKVIVVTQTEGKIPVVGPSKAGPADGVISPFLHEAVKKGQTCYMLLFPGTITSLRHEWTHPKFKSLPANVVTGDIQEARRYFKDHEEEYGYDTDHLIEAVRVGKEFCFGDDDGPDWARTNVDFQYYMQTLVGRVFAEDERENMSFWCAC